MKVFLGLVGWFLISMAGYSQSYTPFDFAHGQWVCGYDVKGGNFSSYGSYYIREDVKFYCEGDTIINDTLYNKLYYRGVARYPEWAKRQLSGYYGPIRNDTLKRQVWFGNMLLYDFNLQVGDSIRSIWLGGERILSIDSVLYCNVYHRRFNYKSAGNYDACLIEGIGSVYGLIPRYMMPNISWLDCYSETNNVICDTCKTPTAVQELLMDEVEIYPNPTPDKVRVTSTIPISSIEIMDLLGNRIWFNPRIDKTEIEIEIREKGVYFLRVVVQGVGVVRKIIRN